MESFFFNSYMFIYTYIEKHLSFSIHEMMSNVLVYINDHNFTRNIDFFGNWKIPSIKYMTYTWIQLYMIPQSKSTQTLCRNNIAGADPGILKKGGGRKSWKSPSGAKRKFFGTLIFPINVTPSFRSTLFTTVVLMQFSFFLAEKGGVRPLPP